MLPDGRPAEIVFLDQFGLGRQKFLRLPDALLDPGKQDLVELVVQRNFTAAADHFHKVNAPRILVMMLF